MISWIWRHAAGGRDPAGQGGVPASGDAAAAVPAAPEPLSPAAEGDVGTRQAEAARSGPCPACGAELVRLLAAAECRRCGWQVYHVLHDGPVRLHLADEDRAIEGDRCYRLANGYHLVALHGVVVATVPEARVKWVEHASARTGLRVAAKSVPAELRCGWCNTPTDPRKDGFHLVHVAFGSTQERYCFCSDDCFEAFRRMYPSRVHRNCYERKCAECDLCIRQFDDGPEGWRALAGERPGPGGKDER